MCGIAVIVNTGGRPARESGLRRMMQAMKHRGPDDEGVFLDGNVGLGFVRLSILDLTEAGRQPMHSPDGRYVIVYNGEIFNYLEIRAELQAKGHTFATGTDTEVLLAAFREWGRACLHRFNGMWAFVLYDRRERKLFGARDRYGIKPFYYFRDAAGLRIASEIPALLGAGETRPEANREAIFDYLVYNRTDHTDRTFFKDVFKLPHGCTIELDVDDPASFRIDRWYDLREQVRRARPFDGADEFRHVFQSSVELRLRSDVPVGVCLSGGLDSSAIVSTLLETGRDDIHTFSAVYGEGVRGDESVFIDEYRPYLRNMHFTRPSGDELLEALPAFVRAHAEPIPGTSPYAQYRVMQLAKEHVVVTLDGQGADELLAGYHYFFGFFFKGLMRSGRIATLGREVGCYVRNHRSLYGLKSLAFFLLPDAARRRAREAEKGYLHADFVRANGHADAIPGHLYGSTTLQDALLNHFEYKLEHLLKWEDRNSMAHSLEGRVPFLDYRLVERTLALDAPQIIRNGTTKHMLREAMRGRLPEKIRVRRDKIGFATPEDDWFRLPSFRAFITEMLHSRSFKEREIVDPVRAIRVYERHLSRKVNVSKEIWKWVHTELWFRMFIDCPDPDLGPVFTGIKSNADTGDVLHQSVCD